MRDHLDDLTADEMDAGAMFDVLLDFEMAHPLPTMDDVRTWQGKHPEYAREILKCAAGIAEHALSGAMLDEPRFDPRDERLVARAMAGAARRR